MLEVPARLQGCWINKRINCNKINVPEQDLFLKQILEGDAVNGSVSVQRALQNNNRGGVHMELT